MVKNDDFRNFGTVMSLDLTTHEIFGKIEVEITSGDIGRIIEYAFERLPDKTEYQKKCKDSVCGWLLNYKKIVEIKFQPVLNKKVLQEYKAYKIA
jgi:hypothetical protein